MIDLLLPVPMWLMALVGIAGVALFMWGNQHTKKAVRNTGLAVILLAVVLLLINHFVETSVEKVSRESRDIIRAVQDGDWQTFKSLTDPKVTLGTVVGTLYQNRDDLMAGAKDAADRYKLKSVNVSSLDVKQDQAGITANIDVFSIQDTTMDRPVPSSWRFEWERTDEGGWLLYRITCLKISDQEAPSIGGLIGK